MRTFCEVFNDDPHLIYLYFYYGRGIKNDNERERERLEFHLHHINANPFSSQNFFFYIGTYIFLYLLHLFIVKDSFPNLQTKLQTV